MGGGESKIENVVKISEKAGEKNMKLRRESINILSNEMGLLAAKGSKVVTVAKKDSLIHKFATSRFFFFFFFFNL